jgi:hypothetical protein
MDPDPDLQHWQLLHYSLSESYSATEASEATFKCLTYAIKFQHYLSVLLSNPFPWRPSSTLLELVAKVVAVLMAKVAVVLMARVAVGLGARLAAVKVAVELVANKVDVKPVGLAAELSAKDGITLLASGEIKLLASGDI